MINNPTLIKLKFVRVVFVCLLILFAGTVYPQEALKNLLAGFDELYLTTTRIESFSNDSRMGQATGFFLRIPESKRLFLITNRHVVIDEDDLYFPDKLKLLLHLDQSNLQLNAQYDVALYNGIDRKQKRWREIDPKIDVVAIELSNADLAKFYFNAFTPNDFAPTGTRLALGEPVAVIGYPSGFSDDVHNLPVARQGAIASAFPLPFIGERHFLIDAFLHPGTSGNPVITRPAATRLTDTGGIVFGQRVYLLGINSGSYGGLNLNAVWFTNVIAELIK